MKITFITGGARSGKSSFAINEALNIEGTRAYIATSEALDDEMSVRIKRHRGERGDDWLTIEEPLSLTKALSEAAEKYDTVLIDCLTLWVTNLMLKTESGKKTVEEEMDEFVNSLNGLNGLNLYIVSNEVGMGIVPENGLARQFRDYAGLLNQKVAAAADEVYLVTAGIPIKIK